MATPASASGFCHSPGAPTQIPGLSGNIRQVHEPAGNWQPGQQHDSVAEWRVDTPVTTEEVDFHDPRETGLSHASTRDLTLGTTGRQVCERGGPQWLHGERVDRRAPPAGCPPCGTGPGLCSSTDELCQSFGNPRSTGVPVYAESYLGQGAAPTDGVSLADLPNSAHMVDEDWPTPVGKGATREGKGPTPRVFALPGKGTAWVAFSLPPSALCGARCLRGRGRRGKGFGVFLFVSVLLLSTLRPPAKLWWGHPGARDGDEGGGEWHDTPPAPPELERVDRPRRGACDRWVGPYLEKRGTYHGYDEVNSEVNAWETTWSATSFTGSASPPAPWGTGAYFPPPSPSSPRGIGAPADRPRATHGVCLRSLPRRRCAISPCNRPRRREHAHTIECTCTQTRRMARAPGHSPAHAQAPGTPQVWPRASRAPSACCRAAHTPPHCRYPGEKAGDARVAPCDW